jgi:peptidoglycan/LPS O-acetylase OafA/YrhL
MMSGRVLSSLRHEIRPGFQQVETVTAVDPADGQPRGHSSAGAWLPSLSGLRFVAVLVVFGFHVHVANVFSDGAIRAVIERIFGPGAGGVSFFFVLSGYVLTWSARPHDTAVRFWRRRFARIYPNYLVALLVHCLSFDFSLV